MVDAFLHITGIRIPGDLFSKITTPVLAGSEENEGVDATWSGPDRSSHENPKGRRGESQCLSGWATAPRLCRVYEVHDREHVVDEMWLQRRRDMAVWIKVAVRLFGPEP